MQSVFFVLFLSQTENNKIYYSSLSVLSSSYENIKKRPRSNGSQLQAYSDPGGFLDWPKPLSYDVQEWK